jgi:hypothetical protein
MNNSFDLHLLKNLLALVLGKKLSLVPQKLLNQLNTDTNLLAHMQFSSTNLTPICSSLQQLKIENFFDLNREESVAFILRHFPKMQHFPTRFLTVDALLLLNDQQQKSNNDFSRTTYQCSSGELGLIEWKLDAPFNGKHTLSTFIHSKCSISIKQFL